MTFEEWKSLQNELGFKKLEPRNKILYQIEYYNEDYNEYISFSNDYYKEYYVENLAIDMDILKAIIQQCEELGWLDDFEKDI